MKALNSQDLRMSLKLFMTITICYSILYFLIIFALVLDTFLHLNTKIVDYLNISDIEK